MLCSRRWLNQSVHPIVANALRTPSASPRGSDGRRKMVRHLRRTGHPAAACTVDFEHPVEEVSVDNSVQTGNGELIS